MPLESLHKPLSETEILRGIRAGSQTHFRLLFDFYYKKLYYISRKMDLCHEDSEEVVQETFLSLWEQRRNLREDGSLAGLLATIAKRITIKKVRSAILKQQHSGHVKQSLVPVYNETEDYIIFSDMESYAQAGIEHLPQQRKQIFMLSKKQGFTNDEIAQKLNLSKRTVENQLYRATKAIKSYLKKEGLLSIGYLVIWLKSFL